MKLTCLKIYCKPNGHHNGKVDRRFVRICLFVENIGAWAPDAVPPVWTAANHSTLTCTELIAPIATDINLERHTPFFK